MSDYFRSCANREADKEASRILTKKKNNDFSDMFTDIGCFDGTLKFQVREGNHL